MNGRTPESAPNAVDPAVTPEAALRRRASTVQAPSSATDSRRAATGPVPLMDPSRVYASWGPEAETEVVQILRSQRYVRGIHVERLEAEFAAYVGVRHAIALDSCTDALTLALQACFEGRPASQREVILPSFTFIATAGAVVNAGGIPRFADVDLDTHCIDPKSVDALLGPQTAAIIPVHLFGMPADMHALDEVLIAAGRREHVFVLEDAAQSIHADIRLPAQSHARTTGGSNGSSHAANGVSHGSGSALRTGAIGDAGTFSFYPSKNVGAAGDAGMLVTNSEAINGLARSLRNHGQADVAYEYERVGTNSRMDEIQAAVLRIKLLHVAAWTEARQAIAARYEQAFSSTLAVQCQGKTPGARSAYHLFTIRVPGRDHVRGAMEEAGIATGIYYPNPLHSQHCFASYSQDPCPNTERLSGEVLSLPCFPGLSIDEQQRVIDATLDAIGD